MAMASNAAKWHRAWTWLGVAAAAAFLAPQALSAKPNCAAAKKTYASSCSTCHQDNGKGYAALMTPDFTDSRWQATHKDSELTAAISNGVNGTAMLGFKDQLTPQQIDDLVKCVVRGFGKGSAPAKPAEPKRSSANSAKD